MQALDNSQGDCLIAARDYTICTPCCVYADLLKPIGTKMFTNLRRDLNAILERDPAASNKWAVVFIPSFQVMLAYRLSHHI